VFQLVVNASIEPGKLGGVAIGLPIDEFPVSRPEQAKSARIPKACWKRRELKSRWRGL